METIKKRFDRTSPYWDKSPEVNKMFFNAQLTYANDVMRNQGFVFLRDLYVCLGLAITKESCIYGWVKGAVREEDFVKMTVSEIEGTEDFELEFNCYPILEYLPVENVAG